MNKNIKHHKGEVHFFDRESHYKKGLNYYKNKMPPACVDEVRLHNIAARWKFLLTPKSYVNSIFTNESSMSVGSL